MKTWRVCGVAVLAALVLTGSACANGSRTGPSDGVQPTVGDPGAAPSTLQPFNNGRHVWATTGVAMTTSVLLVEPWGKRDDFCGDGSCGVADPDDLRFVLRYEVAVPANTAGPFDVTGCPGTLHVESGNDDEALGGVAGDHHRPLGEAILPGATKFGVDEYYVERAYTGQRFYLESRCGDPTGSETAYYTGTIG